MNEQYEPVWNVKNKSTYLIICFIFGIFGGHKFYVERGKTGALYLGCTLIGVLVFIPILLTIVDFIGALFTGSKKFKKEHTKKY